MTSDVSLEAAGHAFTVRVYPAERPSGALLVWAHGGAFLGGSLDMPEADEIARRTADLGVPVVSVGYTLAPADLLLDLPDSERGEHVPSREQVLAEIAASGPRARFPVASLQLVAAYDWAVEHAAEFGADPARIGLGGASAGGNLAAGAALRIRDRGGRQPRALLLCYPALHPSLPPAPPGAAAVEAGAGHPHSGLSLNYVGDPAVLSNPYAFPGAHPAGGLPTAVIVTAEHDELRASGEVYAAEIALAGGDVCLRQEIGSAHGFLNVVGDAAARRTVSRFVAALRESSA